MSFLFGGRRRGLPLASLMQIDAVCDRFEDAWRAGERPDLSSFLADTADRPATGCSTAC